VIQCKTEVHMEHSKEKKAMAGSSSFPFFLANCSGFCDSA
jgi:hypothetical protein